MNQYVALALGLTVGTGIGTILYKKRIRSALADQYAAALQVAERQLTGRLAALTPPTDEKDSLSSLYDKRLTLFNVRREHEWKIYFGALVLLGAIDAAIITDKLVLQDLALALWIVACASVFAIVWGYEAELQKRNDRDRAAMNELYNRLCDRILIPMHSMIREPTAPAVRSRWYRYGWAFPWQMTMLGLAVVASMYAPFAK